MVNTYARECLAREADTSVSSARVTCVLKLLIFEYSRAEAVRLDNGPEFISRRMLGGTEDRWIGLVNIDLALPHYVRACPLH